MRAIERYAMQGYSIAETWRRVKEDFPKEAPSDVTVGKYHKQVTPRDMSGDWHLGDATGEDAAVVLPALAAVIERTRGRTTRLTNGEAEWIVRLTTAAPDIPPWTAYQLARRYLVQCERRESTRELDYAVAFAPWLDGGKAYVEAFAAGWIVMNGWLDDVFSPESTSTYLEAAEAYLEARLRPAKDADHD